MWCSLCHIPHMAFLWGERVADSFWCQITEECAGGFVFSCLATYQLARAERTGQGSSKRKRSWASLLSYYDSPCIPGTFSSGLLFFSYTFPTKCQNIEPVKWLLSFLWPSCHLIVFSLLSGVWLLLFHFFFWGYMTGWLHVVSAWAMLLGQPDSGMQDQELIVGC